MFTENQVKAIDKISNSISCYKWLNGTEDVGFIFQNIEGKKVHYAINPKYWRDCHIPPSFYWKNSPSPSPEARFTRLIDFEFRQIRNSLDPEGLIKPLVLSNLRSETYKISFLTSAYSRYDMDCPVKLLNKSGQIKYKDLITLAKEAKIDVYLQSINKALYHLVGKETYTEMLKCPNDQRTRFLWKMMKPQERS